MAINFSNLRKPDNTQVVDPATGRMREDWLLYFDGLTKRLNGAVDEFGVLPTPAPTDAEYIVGTSNATLSAERVATDTTTVDYDAGTAGQAKWNVKEVPGIAATGITVRTAAATYTARSLAQPAAGLTISNSDGVSGNPTFALADDLAALEAQSGTGLMARTASNTYAHRTITSGIGIDVTNGDGISGNPVLTPTLKRRSITDITSGDTITTADRAKRVRILTGTGTLAFSALATLGDGFWCIIHNAGTGVVTLDPDGAETIDGLTTWKLYSGGIILVQVTASDITSFLLAPMQVTYNASDTFTRPGCGTWAEIEGWGAGGSGGRGAADTGGGAGGGYNSRTFLLSSLGATETVTIGAGGAARAANSDGATGGNSTFGSLLTAYGGGGGDNAGNGGGGGGGQLSAGSIPSGAGGGAPGSPVFRGDFDDVAARSFKDQGNGGDNSVGQEAYVHGGGGGDGANAGGASVYGGGGGAGCNATTSASGGASSFGGAGGASAVNGANATAGTQPGGGGGASEGVSTGVSGAGADGRIIVRVY